MIAKILILSSLLSTTAFATPPAESIAHDLDVRFSDTINEGDRTATVRRERNGEAVVSCDTVRKKSDPTTSIAKCRVDVQVRIDHCRVRPSVTDCFLIYEFRSVNARDPLRAHKPLIDACIEKLNSVECGD